MRRQGEAETSCRGRGGARAETTESQRKPRGNQNQRWKPQRKPAETRGNQTETKTNGRNPGEDQRKPGGNQSGNQSGNHPKPCGNANGNQSAAAQSAQGQSNKQATTWDAAHIENIGWRTHTGAHVQRVAAPLPAPRAGRPLRPAAHRVVDAQDWTTPTPPTLHRECGMPVKPTAPPSNASRLEGSFTKPGSQQRGACPSMCTSAA
jgi:hypothetical protein